MTAMLKKRSFADDVANRSNRPVARKSSRRQDALAASQTEAELQRLRQRRPGANYEAQSLRLRIEGEELLGLAYAAKRVPSNRDERAPLVGDRGGERCRQ